MRHGALFFLVCLGAIGALVMEAKPRVMADDAAAAKKELAKFQGAWEIVHLEYNGQDFSEKLKLTMVVKGMTAVVEGDDSVKKEYAKIGFKFDPTTMPKLFDVDITGGVQKGAGMEGIYQFKGDELHFAVKVLGMDRPSEFKSPDGSSIAYLRLKKKS